jgi:site-specific DNA-methyltransferase (adenine-specific)
MNKLYFGDNLDIMKRMYYQEHQKEFIDLIYIDPPFNSKRNYNVLFESVEMTDTKAQKEAFADTWSNVSYVDTLNEIQELDLNLYNFLNALDNINISKSAISYLTTMSIRILYMYRLLKLTGSFYLHCDPTMSHYLKIVCDLIFGERNFRNEIVWSYRRWTGSAKAFMRMHDIILFYAKDKDILEFNVLYTPYTEKSLARKQFYHTRIKGDDIYETSIDEKGVKENDVWNIQLLNSQSKERLGYPTQKPEALLDRIISASSNPGDVVADMFCGCGTTIASAQKLDRQWIGSDISHLAVKLITKRLVDTYGDQIKQTFEIHGFPKDLDSAKELASGVKGGRLLFEEWIVEVLLHGVLNDKRNEMGYDGHFTFDMNGVKNVGLIEVKSGGASPTQLNHFIKTVEDRKAQMGIFICFADEITDRMRVIAKKEGLFTTGYKYEKIQIMTVEDLLNGKLPDRPASRVETFKQAERKIQTDAEQKKLF